MSVAASIHGNVLNSCTKKSVISIDDSSSDDEDLINEDEDSTDAIKHNSHVVKKENDAVSTDEGCEHNEVVNDCKLPSKRIHWYTQENFQNLKEALMSARSLGSVDK
eukprot:8395876-Ditylum_brightwellii.AAC.1